MPKTNTLFPWPGGKTRLLQHLLPLLSDNPHTCYVEAFAGGGRGASRRERIYTTWKPRRSCLRTA